MERRFGFQSILDPTGKELLEGMWDPQALYMMLTCGDDGFWSGKRVLDIGANTCGLSLEIARRGASVVALEPDPFKLHKPWIDVVVKLAADEGLRFERSDKGLFDAHTFERADVVLCLGLLYHFRYPQLILDYLSTLGMDWLFLSSQVHQGESLALVNRLDASVGLQKGFFSDSTILSGWHPTRPLLERMLRWAGFDDIVSLTDQPYTFPRKASPRLTNSAYYRCKRVGSVDPWKAMTDYYPR